MILENVTFLVPDYDAGMAFFVQGCEMEVVEDVVSGDGDDPSRFLVVRPRGAETGLVLVRADTPERRIAMGEQAGGGVGFFLRVQDFDVAHARLAAAGARFLEEPRDEPWGRVAVFADPFGNRWDLLGPRPSS